MTPSPPPLAERALALTVGDPDWRDAILGDLREEFLLMARRHGPSYARRWYWAQAIGVAAHRTVARVTGTRRVTRLAVPEPPEPRAGWLALVWHDLHSAWRSLRHQPALSLTVVAILALGLAANATIFAQADAIVLRPFRYPGVERAAVIASDSHQRFYDRESVAPGDFLDWCQQARDVFDRLAAIEWWDPQYLLDGPPQQLTGLLVSPELFEVVGEAPLLGRTLIAADATGQTPAVVLGYEFWRRQFGGRTDVLGQQLRLAGVSHQVVGVMPASFRVPYGSDVWAPLRLTPQAQSERARGYLTVVGRLAPGVTVAAAEQRLQAILVEQRRAFPDSHAKREVSVRTFTDGFGDAGAGPFVAVWQIAAFVLLLVACANVANLCWRGTRNVNASSRCASRWAPAGGAWLGSCWSKVRCWRPRPRPWPSHSRGRPWGWYGRPSPTRSSASCRDGPTCSSSLVRYWPRQPWPPARCCYLQSRPAGVPHSRTSHRVFKWGTAR